MTNILFPQQKSNIPPTGFALFRLGFRPFFLLASLLALVSMLAWGRMLLTGKGVAQLPMAPLQWHAHEMLFGYGMAVVAGFLLTAVRNWTQVPTLRGAQLGLLAMLWLGARVCMLLWPAQLWVSMALDLLFNFGLAIALALPLIQGKQMRQQAGLWSKVVLLGLANLLFYLGALGMLAAGVRWGLYAALYLLLSLMFVMARRVLPFFIERGVGYPVQIRNRVWLDRGSLVLMLLFMIVDVFTPYAVAASVLAGALFVVHGLRLWDWHTPGLWRKPLLWVLYLGYAIAVCGFLLKALSLVLPLSPFLSVHAFALGGIALMTMGMMARVTLGHTGRDVQQAPRWLRLVFWALLAAVVARVLLPLLLPDFSEEWMALALAFWLYAFAIFLYLYAAMWFKPRVDGQAG